MSRRVLSRRIVLAMLPLLLGVSSCVPSFDDNLPLIQSPTLLAIQSEPAEVAPGESVRLSALVGTPDPSGATPALDWGLCTARKPLTELGPVNPVCIQAPSRAPDRIIALGRGETVSGTVPMEACRLFGPSLPEPMNGEPAGRPVDPDPTGGFYQPVSATLSSNGATSLGAVRIFCPPSGLDQQQAADYKSNYRNNQNPTVDRVLMRTDSGASQSVLEQPEPLRVAPGQVVKLVASWAACPSTPSCGDGVCGAGEDKNNCPDDCATPKGCTGPESYAWFNPESRELETRRESIRISWFATAGRIADAVTGSDENEFDKLETENTWTAPENAGLVRFWAVVRDSRGGQSFRSFTLSVAR